MTARKATARTATGPHDFPEFYLLEPDLTAADIQGSENGVVELHVGTGRYSIVNVGDGLGLKTDAGYFVGEVTEKTDPVWEQAEPNAVTGDPGGPVLLEEGKLEVQVL